MTQWAWLPLPLRSLTVRQTSTGRYSHELVLTSFHGATAVLQTTSGVYAIAWAAELARFIDADIAPPPGLVDPIWEVTEISNDRNP